jgi:hypothetical protein
VRSALRSDRSRSTISIVTGHAATAGTAWVLTPIGGGHQRGIIKVVLSTSQSLTQMDGPP